MKKRQWTRRPWKVSSVKNERKVLKNKSILLGVTGGVAAYKAVDLIRRLREEGASVTVIMTEAARNFVTPLSLEVASQNKVYSDLFSDPMSHITSACHADVMVIAPATANIIGKFANGHRRRSSKHLSSFIHGESYHRTFNELEDVRKS